MNNGNMSLPPQWNKKVELQPNASLDNWLENLRQSTKRRAKRVCISRAK